MSNRIYTAPGKKVLPPYTVPTWKQSNLERLFLRFVALLAALCFFAGVMMFYGLVAEPGSLAYQWSCWMFGAAC